VGCLLLASLVLPAARARSSQPPAADAPPRPVARAESVSDPLFAGLSARTLERLRYDCRAENHRRDVTLFANGTLRLRQGEPGSEAMWLLELLPEDRDAYLARLAGDDRGETERDASTVGGDWIERCRLTIHLPGKLPEEYELGRFDSLSLALRRAVEIAEELVARVDTAAPPEGATRLPSSYGPKVGDELRRADGEWFRVTGFTADGGGVELLGSEQPIVLYIAIANLGREFVELRRRERPGW
jgi:hypothetical protein